MIAQLKSGGSGWLVTSDEQELRGSDINGSGGGSSSSSNRVFIMETSSFGAGLNSSTSTEIV
jgi:hypothetical protein